MSKPTNKPRRTGKAGASLDAVAYKRAVQERLFEATKGLTPEQEREFYRKSVDRGPLGTWWRTLNSDAAARAGKRRRRSA